MKIIDIDLDNERESISIMTKMQLDEYKELAFKSFEANGNFYGQRGVIKKSSAAARIRKRMKDDFSKGAIFPQVVIGMESDICDFINKRVGEEYKIIDFVQNNEVSIIDGMQRSSVYFDSFIGNEKREIRVEFWIATDSIQLLYRMLVLNTGQTPWNTRRQIEVIYTNLSNNINKKLFEVYPELTDSVKIHGIDDGKKRTSAGIYHKVSVIEMYLGFNTRSIKINMSDELSEEYQRFDMMESIEKNDSFIFFVQALGLMCKLDLAFAGYDNEVEKKGQFNVGKDLFGSTPVCIGFMVACAEYIMGKVSVERTDEQKRVKMEELTHQVKNIEKKIVEEQDGDNDFISLNVLNEICEALPKSRIGDEMRRLFKNVFMSMLKYDDFDEIVSLEDFWRE